MARFTYIPNRVIDTNGISDGANLYFYETGTTTPITVYSDEARTTPVSNPYPIAAGAAVPALYYAEDDIRVKVVDSGGATVSDDDPYERPINQVELASTDSSKGAYLVGWISSTTSAVARTVGDIFEDRLSVMDFIPLTERVKIRLGTSTADLASYFEAAAAAGWFYVPPGTYNVGAVSASGDLRMYGDGVINATGNIAPGAAASALRISGLTLNFSKGTGIFHASAGAVIPRVRIADIILNGGSGIKLLAGASDVYFGGSYVAGLDAATNAVAALQVGNNDYTDSLASNNIRIVGVTVDGVSNDSSAETHAFLLYGTDIAIAACTIRDVYHSAEVACEAIYAKGVRVSINGVTVLDCGPSNDACITVKGTNRGETSAPQGHECTITGSTVAYEKNNTTSVKGIETGIANTTLSGNTLYNARIAVVGDSANTLVTGNNTYIVADGYAEQYFLEQEGGDATWKDNRFTLISQNKNTSTMVAAMVRGLTTTTKFNFTGNDVRVDFQGVTTGGSNAQAAMQMWCDSQPIIAKIKNNEFEVIAAGSVGPTRFSSLFASGAQDLTLELTGNSDNYRILKDSSSGTKALDISRNKSPVVPLTTANVGLVAAEYDARVDNIGATGTRKITLSTAVVGKRVEITASSRSYGITVAVPGGDAWHDGTSSDLTLSSGGRAILQCCETGYWTNTELAGTLS